MTKVKLSSIVECVVDNRGKTPPLSNEGIPLIEAQTITGCNLYVDTHESQKFVDVDTFNTWFRNGHPIKNDLIVTLVGGLGDIALMSDDKACIAQNIVAIRFKKDVNPIFINYLLKTSTYQKAIKSLNRSSVQPSINVSDFLDIEIQLPSIIIQDKVAEILSKIDIKIKENDNINKTLREIEDLIFKFWFMQFEFPENDGVLYKSNGGQFKWNDELKINIPVKWNVNKIGQYISLERGISYSSENLDNNGIPMVNLNSFNTDSSYKVNGLKKFLGKYNKEKVVKPYDLLMCITQQTAIDLVKNTDVIGKTFLMPDIYDEDIVISMDVINVKTNSSLSKYYINSLFRQQYFRKYITGFANGTKIKHLDTSGLLDFPCIIPPEDILKKYDEIVIDYEKKRSNLIRENIELNKLRNYLMPLLINCQVKFKELNDFIEVKSTIEEVVNA